MGGKRAGTATWLSPAEFQTLTQKHPTATRGLGILKQYIHDETKSLDDAGRTIRWTITTGNVDRDRDVVTPGGVKTDAYLKNPIVLFGHDYHNLPVAKTTNLRQDGNKWSADAQFASADLYPFADTVYRMVKGGFLNASSIGFRPMEWTFNEDRRGVDFMSIELLEWSVVPVPAHPEALVEARSAGIDIAPLKTWAEELLDNWTEESGLLVPRAQAEAVYRIANGYAVSLPKIEGKTDQDSTNGESTKPLSNEATLPEDGEPTGKRGRVLIRFPGQSTTGAKVVVDGKDVTNQCKALTVSAAAGGLVNVNLDLLPTDTDIEADHAQIETKRGRVLSAANEKKLRDAHAMIGEVCAQVEPKPDEDAIEIIANKAEEEVIVLPEPEAVDLPDIQRPTELNIDIDPDMLQTVLMRVISSQVKETVAASTQRAINAARGRVD
jgi:HK97 family phage prohead protease